MNRDSFLFWAEKIDDSSLTEEQYQEKLIQIADVHRFISIYNDPLLIIDCLSYRINILVDEIGNRIGIFFMENQEFLKPCFDGLLLDELDFELFKQQEKINSFWLVIVSNDNIDLNNLKSIINSNNLKSISCKSFKFDYVDQKVAFF